MRLGFFTDSNGFNKVIGNKLNFYEHFNETNYKNSSIEI